MAYTNSPLVVHTKLSPNHSGQRTHSIDRISPHCVVGQCTAESLGSWFASSDRQASSNYGIDRDGRVGMYVEEKNRSWCTSSRENDQRAITIECASDTSAPYAMKDAVYETLINLCADICKRNGKTKLLWFADKAKTLAYTPATDEMVITVHRWFANKSCPGDWLYSRLGDLAAKVTALLNTDKPTTDTTPAEPIANTEKYIWDYLYGKLGNAYGAAGMMGNLNAESSLRPNNLQNSFEKKLGYTDDEYIAAVDNGTYTNFVYDGAGVGLAQWTYHSRKKALLDFAKARGKSIGDLTLQLDFLWKELTESYSTLLKLLQTTDSVEEASTAVLTKYERPADMGAAVQAKRASFGQSYFTKYATVEYPAKLTTGYYRVRKTWADKKSQIGAYRILANAKKTADKNPGTYVFTNDGVAIYPAQEQAAVETYRVHTVVKGDTLWEIAKKYLGNGSRYPEIKTLNGLTSNVIYTGWKLKIPN